MIRKILSLIMAMTVIFSSCVSFISPAAFAKSSQDEFNAYLIDYDAGINLQTQKVVSRNDESADFYFNSTGNFYGVNGAMVQDLGEVNYDSTTPPQYGYTLDKVKVVEGHVYAVKSLRNGLYCKFKVMNYEEYSNVEIVGMVYSKESIENQNDPSSCIYLFDYGSGFDLSGDKVISKSDKLTDFYFSPTGYFYGENGGAVQDLGDVEYDSASIPEYGYSVDKVKVVEGHVYSVKSPKGLYMKFEVTHYEEYSCVEMRYRIYTSEEIKDSGKNDDNNNTIETIDNIKVSVNGKTLNMGDSIYVNDEAAFVSFDDMLNILGAKYSVLDGDKGIVLIIRGTDSMTIQVDSKNAVFNKKAVTMDAAPMLEDKTFIVPFKSILMSFGGEAALDENTNVLSIKIAPPKQIQTPKPVTSSKTAYWVENKTNLVYNGKVILRDGKGIYNPLISPNHKYLVYSEGSYDLFFMDLGSKKVKRLYREKASNYRVYPMGWSSNSSQILFVTNYAGGFLGGNTLNVINVSNGKTKALVKGVSSAAWAKDGKIAAATASSMFILDTNGRKLKTLSLPESGWYADPDNPSFSPDSKKIVYNAGTSYYLHDIGTNKYTEIFKVSYDTGETGRIAKDGKVIVCCGGSVYVYDPSINQIYVYYNKAKCTYANWY